MVWQDMEFEDYDEEEEESEEDAMLHGEPSVRDGDSFAYGGPLPPS